MRTSIGLGLAVLVAACGGGSGGGSISLDDLPDELELAQCEAAVACGTMPDVDTCLAAIFAERDDELKTLTAGIEAGTITYDAEAAGDCLEYYSNVTCRLSGTEDETLEDACRDVFVGQVADGGACVEDEECADDGDCVVDGCSETCCVGACAPRQGEGGGTVEIGGDCSEATCVDGAYCHNNFSTGAATCQALVADGGACGDYDACAPGLWCAGFDFEVDGTCRQPPDRGESCEGFGLCDRPDDYCDPTDWICKVRKGPGEACGVDTDECIYYTTCLDGTCTAYPGEGGDCSVIQSCLGDLDCSSGSCVAPADEPACDIPAP